MRSCNHALGEKMAGRFGWAVREWFKYKNKLGDRMIKQLSNSVIAKYCDLSMSRRSIICLSLRLRQIIDLLATDKSQYFAQPRPIIVKYWWIFSAIIHTSVIMEKGIVPYNCVKGFFLDNKVTTEIQTPKEFKVFVISSWSLFPVQKWRLLWPRSFTEVQYWDFYQGCASFVLL